MISSHLNSYLLKYVLILRALSLAVILFQGISIAAQPGFTEPEKGSQFIKIDSILISGNKITRDFIILRELFFQEGEYVKEESLDSLIYKSRENLLNTLLFNFVEVEKYFTHDDSSKVIISIKTVE